MDMLSYFNLLAAIFVFTAGLAVRKQNPNLAKIDYALAVFNLLIIMVRFH